MLVGIREHIGRLRQVINDVRTKSREELIEAGQQITSIASRCESTEGTCARVSDKIAKTQRQIISVRDETAEIAETVRTLTNATTNTDNLSHPPCPGKSTSQHHSQCQAWPQ
eukprot:gnl/Chilomastix_caulleri/3209.p1 GENE.gnl/Chilomastix_caulleri/3209~~gnl/Chilomastix_caulleri/3209.p1  ORF type:complete len:112 (+),score=21.47 gnl/Chilomastix_caulleri/3209:107-442(+)